MVKTFKEFIIEEDEHQKAFENLKNNLTDKNIEHGLSHSSKDNHITVHKISVKKSERNLGKGSEAMKLITNHADKFHKKIVLSPGTDFGGSSVNRLKKFYKKHDFVENKGRNKDYTLSHSMYRNPK